MNSEVKAMMKAYKSCIPSGCYTYIKIVHTIFKKISKSFLMEKGKGAESNKQKRDVNIACDCGNRNIVVNLHL